MWALSLAVAVAANLFASTVCAQNYTEARLRFCEANTRLCGIGIDQWFQYEPERNQVSRALPLLFMLSELSLNSKEDTTAELYKNLNLRSEDEVVSVNQIAYEKTNKKNEVYQSTLILNAYTDIDSPFSETFIQNFAKVFNGTVKNIDYCNDAVATIRDSLQSDSGNDIEIALKDGDIDKETGIILTAYTNIYLPWGQASDSYRPYKQIDISFTALDGTQSNKQAWYSEGAGKYAEIENLGIKIFQFYLRGGISVVLGTSLNDNEDLSVAFNKLRDPATLPYILTQTESKYLKLAVPIELTLRDSRDYVPEVKRAGLLTEIFEKNFDGFDTVYDNKSGYISHMLSHMRIDFEQPTEEQAESVVAEPDFIFNKPYFFLILNKYNAPGFVGLITH
ncbi:uncharacterized protein LOC114248580 [Bombyx mandarina]|uniref:Uncharacterized protein LOC114248580 n=1 Tax=Bombyx mandarina TaxID=7092 RepID=A0A6J2K9P8_BOMMA|nr:uncharacterized protein LOC114248580 [Bombyx mandarina]